MQLELQIWEFQDPKMEVLYHIRPYFLGISPYIGLTYGRYLQFRFLKWPLKMFFLPTKMGDNAHFTCKDGDVELI
jgi:hypothetical protein